LTCGDGKIPVFFPIPEEIRIKQEILNNRRKFFIIILSRFKPFLYHQDVEMSVMERKRIFLMLAVLITAGVLCAGECKPFVRGSCVRLAR
jgi:hypothetical protein